MSYINSMVKARMPQINIVSNVNTVAEVNVMPDIRAATIRSSIVPA